MPADVIPLPLTDEQVAWRQRETNRFVSGEYKHVPWADAPWWIERAQGTADAHYAHVSTADASKLAYTPSEEHGRGDRQVRIKAGKYLRKYFGETLTAPQIQEWAGKFAAENESHELRLATTPDDIEHVYLNGPNSCMSHKADSFDGPCHPARAYGAGDLAVAYVQRGDAISARAMCWPAKHIWCGVVYGDNDRLVPVLESEGYTVGSFDGARLLKIEADGDSFVAPWLDGPCSNVDICGETLVIRRHGAHSARETNGVCNGGPTCDSCDDSCGEEPTTVGGETWCQGCYENGAFFCEGCDECYPDSEYHNVEESSWCASCVRHSAFQCHECNEFFADHGSTAQYEVDGRTWCETCAMEKANYCETCGEFSVSDEHVTIEGSGETCCEECARDKAYRCEGCDEWHDASTRPVGASFLAEGMCAFCWRVWYEDSEVDGTAPAGVLLAHTPSALLPAVCASTRARRLAA